ncbi:class I SAM-dependent methyltransferase [Mariprofundus sp. EBB-1]|uniref:rhodoquinone biosynthesis methyltransferase RquA n=1 Tax=Mariprofundus sp. EBB-1 TaxID=2650971 RepID=UPI000EF185E6|nr:rhodoquinone biosynthesis methyltransferase RquA [Mariprofundus sp. EBB-1]RLL53298.1 class I SAM-dependent methyltransferase [Mariprofundus sp. EBB-1]
MFKLYRDVKGGMPGYLVRHYWWAYLWPKAVWFFDHQMIINAILFGQYKKLMDATLLRLEQAPLESVLQLTCVYGSLTPNLIQRMKPLSLHITDVAPVQLALAKSKAADQHDLLATRMNTESLAYKSDSFSAIVLFFLLHEMPHEARAHTLSETMRTLRAGGSLIITEYGVLPETHLLYRFPLTRWLITRLEPFLNSYWHEDIEALLNSAACIFGKQVEVVSHQNIFCSFYRVTEFRVMDISERCVEKHDA